MAKAAPACAGKPNSDHRHKWGREHVNHKAQRGVRETTRRCENCGMPWTKIETVAA